MTKIRKYFHSASVALCFSVGTSVAAPTTIIDTTPGSAVNDGTINVGEYVGNSSGINGGFGDVIGSSSLLNVDSDLAGNLHFGLQSGGGNLNDIMVIYIDSVSGGFGNTSAIEDDMDGGRAAISGDAEGAGTAQSEITFAPGFLADFALTLDQNFSGLFSLAAGGPGSLGFVSSANVTPTGNPTASAWEANITLGGIGLAPGGSFKYVATYLSLGNSAFRSDEFHGVAASTVGPGNIGHNPITLNPGDWNTFQAIPEPATWGLFGILFFSTFLLRRRRAA